MGNHIFSSYDLSDYSGFQLTLAMPVAKFVGKFGTTLLICQSHRSVSQPDCELCFEFCELKNLDAVFEDKTILNMDQRTKGNI